jgi:hypothetical protein
MICLFRGNLPGLLNTLCRPGVSERPSDFRSLRHRKRLMDIYTEALSAFHKSQQPILAGVLHGHPRYAKIRELQEQAYDSMLKARRLYWEHIQEHNCRARGLT